MKILLISSYPSNYNPSTSIFVYRLMQGLIQQGCEVVVISPQPWREKIKNQKELPGQKSYGFEHATVYRPKYFDFPNRARIGRFTLGKYNEHTYKGAVKKVVKDIDFIPDIVYAHFLYRPGPAAIWAANYFGVPAVAALGESTIDKHVNIFGKEKMKNLVHQFSGIISVSEKNKNYCINELQADPEKIKVFPNAVNTELFYPRDKKAMRDKYDLPQDTFIVAFTGHFIERKGPLRVLEALEGIEGNIGGVFIGKGTQEPNGYKVLFKGAVTHQEVPELLSAADIFVLPTLNEGSCNAVFEAMACGLPVVSSDIPAIKEQVNDKNALLCNPKSIDQIKNSILTLFENEERLLKMKKSALSDINSSKERAIKIKDYLNYIIKKF